jgi:hypothetical protein
VHPMIPPPVLKARQRSTRCKLVHIPHTYDNDVCLRNGHARISMACWETWSRSSEEERRRALRDEVDEWKDSPVESLGDEPL